MRSIVAMRTIVAFLIALPLAAQPQPARGSAEDLEQRVAKNPENLQDRAALLRVYRDNLAVPPSEAVREPRRQHILWVIENHPEFGELSQPHMMLDSKSDPEGYAEVSRLWKDKAAKPQADPRVISNAVRFFMLTKSPAAALEVLEPAWKARAAEPAIARVRGELDA